MEEKIISFRADKDYLEKIDALGKVYELDRSKTIRVLLDEAIRKHVSKGYQGEFIVFDSKTFFKMISKIFYTANIYIFTVIMLNILDPS